MANILVENSSAANPSGSACANSAFIYLLSDPTTGTPRYVGKTCNLEERYRRHLQARDKTRNASWVKSLKVSGKKPTIEVLEVFPHENTQEWMDAESYWISSFRFMGFDLTNLASGGGSGMRHSPETIERMRLVQSQKSPETYAKGAAKRLGRKHTPEAIEKMRVAQSNRSAEWQRKMTEARTGLPLTPKQIAYYARRKASGGYVQSPEAIAKTVAKNTGRKRTPEQIERIRQSIIESFKRNPDRAAKISQSRTGFRHSDESKTKMSLSQKGKKISEEWKIKQSQAKTGIPWSEARRAAFLEPKGEQ